MEPREVRERILADHAAVREILDAVGVLAERVAAGEPGVMAALRERGLALHERLCEHLDLEDRILAPALRRAGGGGAQGAERLDREHAEQRNLLEYTLGRLRDASRPELIVARDLQGLIEVLRSEMAYEEETLLGAVLPGEPAAPRS